MALTTVTPGKFSAEAFRPANTGSTVLVASGPASSLATHQFSGQVDANDDIALASKKALVIESGATAAVTGNVAGFVRIATAGSTLLTNARIKSRNTPIILQASLNTGVRGFASLNQTRMTAGSCKIELRSGSNTAVTGRVYYWILSES